MTVLVPQLHTQKECKYVGMIETRMWPVCFFVSLSSSSPSMDEDRLFLNLAL